MSVLLRKLSDGLRAICHVEDSMFVLDPQYHASFHCLMACHKELFYHHYCFVFIQMTWQRSHCQAILTPTSTTQTFYWRPVWKTLNKQFVKLENDLRSVAKWCFEHQLLINPNKTKFLLVGSRPMLQNLPTNISLNFLKQTMNLVTSAKDLGTTFDSILSYNEHISNLTSSSVKDSFDVKTLQSIVEMLVINKLT